MEVWRVIKNTDEKYLISSNGRLLSKYFNKERIMKPAKDKKGYLRTMILINGKPCTKKIHRLVAEAFLENNENKPQVNHINGIKSDNNVLNLEWVNCKENMIHALRNNLIKVPTCPKDKKAKGSKNGNAKLSESQVFEISEKFKPRIYTRKMLSLEYNVSELTIKDVILRSWKHI